LLVYKGKSKNW